MADNNKESLVNASLLLGKRCFKEALDTLQELTPDKALRSFQEEIAELNANYALLIRYFEEGMPDPTRQDQLNALYCKTWNLIDRMIFAIKQPLTDEYLSDQITQQMVIDFHHTSLSGKERDEQLGQLFRRIQNSFPIAREVRHALHEVMLDEEVPLFERATILSAITLNLFQWFDASMLENIYTYSLDDQPKQIRSQALVTLALCGILYGNRICHERRLSELYRLLVETEGELLAAIEINIAHCRNYEKFRTRLNNIVKLELGKIQNGKPHLSLQEFVKLFNDGADHNYYNFKLIYKGYPFFSQPDNDHHWLMPFTPEQYFIHEIVQKFPKSDILIKLMNSSLSQTDCCKYAHVMSILRELPAVVNQVQDKISDLPVSLEDLAEPEIFNLTHNYMLDLYRYLSLSKNGKQIENPMEIDVNYSEILSLKEVHENEKLLEVICRSFYKNEFWSLATSCLEQLTALRPLPELLDMLAHAAEQSERVSIAKQALSRKISLYGGDIETFMHLIEIYDKQQEYVFEESVLHEALKSYPDNDTLLLHMGLCLNKQHRYKEALSILSRSASLQEDDSLKHSAFCQLTIANLALQHTDAASAYISKIQAEDDDEISRPLRILTALRQDNNREAVKLYRLTIENMDNAEAYEQLDKLSQTIELTDSDYAAISLLYDMNK